MNRIDRFRVECARILGLGMMDDDQGMMEMGLANLMMWNGIRDAIRRPGRPGSKVQISVPVRELMEGDE